ncbi:MAG TPA: hypothetical protein VLQ80_19755, partial [Candidatus Saccharimonadia bacterium]|nr:hypothetical protein [Candidatus Saccharimonadia bacterium]
LGSTHSSIHVVRNDSLVVQTERDRIPEQPQGVRRSEKVRGKDSEGKVRVLEKTYPQQLMLFQTFLPEDASDDKYSNTIELYDAIPKYVTNPKLVDAMREGGKYLPLINTFAN